MDDKARLKAGSIIDRSIDWQAFIRHMQFHRLTAPVYENLKLYFAARVPCRPLMAIKAMYRTHIMNGLKNMTQVIRLASAFEAGGIPVLFCKGVSLSMRLYQNPLARHAGDIDMLIPATQVHAAHILLISMGYRRVEPPEELKGRRFRQYMDFRFHSQYRLPGQPLVELHWRFCNNRQMFLLDFFDLWHQKQMVCLGRVRISTLGDVHALAFLFIHGTKHGWERFFWLKDIGDYAALTAPEAQERWISEAKAHRICHFVVEGYYLLHRFYGTRLPQGLDKPLGWPELLAAKSVSCNWTIKDNAAGILLFFLHKVFFFNRFHVAAYIRSQLLSRCGPSGIGGHFDFTKKIKAYLGQKLCSLVPTGAEGFRRHDKK